MQSGPVILVIRCHCVCVCVYVFFILTHRALTIPSNTLLYAVVPIRYCTVRGLLDSKRSQEHLQSSNESIKTKKKAKMTRRKENKIK